MNDKSPIGVVRTGVSRIFYIVAAGSTRALGVLLLFVGVVALPLSAFYFGVGLITIGIHGESQHVFTAMVVLFASFLPLMGSWFLIGGRKRLVLFLRRFGNEQLNDAIRALVRSRLYREYRLVTLDDSAFKPAGSRWRALLYSLIVPVVILASIVYIFDDSYQRIARSELMDHSPFGTGMVLLMVLMFVLFVVILGVALVLVAVSVRSQFTGRRDIRDAASRARIVRRLKRYKSLLRAPGIAAPMATVITCVETEWQAAVSEIGAISEIALVDISKPSESILWELKELGRQSVKSVLLADRSSFALWWDGCSMQHDDLSRRTRELAAGQTIVLYDGANKVADTELVSILSMAGHASTIGADDSRVV